MSTHPTIWVEAAIPAGILHKAGIPESAIKPDTHCTVYYHGEGSSEDAAWIGDLLEVWQHTTAPLKAAINGHGTFLVGPRNFAVNVALVDSVGLGKMHWQLRQTNYKRGRLSEAFGGPPAPNHDDHGYTAHVTLAHAAVVTRATPFTIDTITLVQKHGSGKSKEYVRTAYRIGG